MHAQKRFGTVQARAQLIKAKAEDTMSDVV